MLLLLLLRLLTMSVGMILTGIHSRGGMSHSELALTARHVTRLRIRRVKRRHRMHVTACENVVARDHVTFRSNGGQIERTAFDFDTKHTASRHIS